MSSPGTAPRNCNRKSVKQAATFLLTNYDLQQNLVKASLFVPQDSVAEASRLSQEAVEALNQIVGYFPAELSVGELERVQKDFVIKALQATRTNLETFLKLMPVRQGKARDMNLGPPCRLPALLLGRVSSPGQEPGGRRKQVERRGLPKILWRTHAQHSNVRYQGVTMRRQRAPRGHQVARGTAHRQPVAVSGLHGAFVTAWGATT